MSASDSADTRVTPLMRALFLLLALLFPGISAAQNPSSAEEVFGKPVSAEAQVWIDDAVGSYNTAMAALRRDWLSNTSSARTELKRRQVIFESEGGRLIFDAKMIGTYRRRDEKWLWVWGWSNPFVASNFRLPSSKLVEVGASLDIPFLTTEKFFALSPDLPFLIGAAVLKTNGGVGIHRVRVDNMVEPFDVYYLLSNPRREGGG